MNGPFNTAEAITQIRLALYDNGYYPVPVLGAYLGVKSAGKKPTMGAWQDKCLKARPQDIREWTTVYSRDVNTGLLCGRLTPIDIDVLDDELVDILVERATELLGATPLRRTGRAP